MRHPGAGGVTASYFEWVQDDSVCSGRAKDIYDRLERVMKAAVGDVLKIHLERNVSMPLPPTCSASAAWRRPCRLAASIRNALYALILFVLRAEGMGV